MSADPKTGLPVLLGRSDPPPPGAPPPPIDLIDAALLSAMVEELRPLVAREPRMLLLSPLAAIQLAGLIQLALRHDGLSASPRAAATVFLDDVRDYFAGMPATLEVLRRGDDPAYDREMPFQ